MGRKDKVLMGLLLMLMCSAVLLANSTPKIGVTSDAMSVTLTKSTATYLPATGALEIPDMGYFGAEVRCDDASGDAISATVGIQTSFDGTNWVTATQTTMFPTTAAAGATMAIATDNGYYHASVKPIPCPYYRFIITEAGGQSDITCYIKVFHQ